MEYRLFYPGGDTTVMVYRLSYVESYIFKVFQPLDSIQIDPDNEVLNGVAGVQEATQKKSSGSRFSIYPNPNNGSFTFKLINGPEESQSGKPLAEPSEESFGDALDDITVEVYNMTGQQVYNRRYEGCLPYLTYTVEMGDLTGGIYFARFAYGNTFEIKKIIIE